MKPIYLLVLLFTVACSSKHNDFEQYLNEIEALKLPITFRTMAYPEVKIEDKTEKRLFDRYKYVYANKVYGKVIKAGDAIGVIYTVFGDVGVPVLVTYDKSGNKIDSLNLFENASGFDTEAETFVSVTISPDLTIQEIDSTQIEQMDTTAEASAAGLVDLQIDTLTYLVNSEGKIIRSKNGR